MTDHRIGDSCRVVFPNAFVLAFINLTTLRACGEFAMIGLSIAYTLWRWRRDARQLRKGGKDQ